MGRLQFMLFVWLLALPAQAQVDTCLRVLGGDGPALERLVRSELARHPSHRESTAHCSQELEVEQITLGGEVYLTGRVLGQVPARVPVARGRTDLAVAELLRIVLGNDPVVLRDPRRGDLFSRALFGLRRRAHPVWGFAAGERWVFAGGTPRALPLVSAFYAREWDALQLGLRIDVSVWAGGRLDALHPTLIASLVPELAWFSSRTADTAAFVSLGLGVSHQRLRGPRRDEPGSDGEVARTGVLFAPRGGVELFRTTSARLSLFGEVALPLFSADDGRTHVVRGFTPSLAVGLGVGF